MKYIILAVLCYFAYRQFIRPALEGPEEKKFVPPPERKDKNDEEYIDYEEVS